MTHHAVSSRLLAAALLAFTSLGCSPPREASAGGEVTQADNELERALAGNATLRGAVKAIDDGHPWMATVAVAPLLTAAKKDRAAVLVAARAAAAWDGWAEVEKVLGSQTWLDSAFNGEGRELMARASLARGDAAAGIRNAESAVRMASGATSRAARQVYLARSLDRSEPPDTAARLYRTAAASLPAIADWLALRAAGAERDADVRAKDYQTVKTEVARARIAWTEAQARERFGDLAGAADRYGALKARVSVLRVRLALATDSDTRTRVKDSLVAFLRGQPSRDDARTVVQMLDVSAVALSSGDELAVGRALAAPGPLTRAVAAYDKARRAGALTPDDRVQYAQLLARSNRTRDALAQLDSVLEPSPVAARAAYQRARIVMTSTGASQAMLDLRAVADRYQADAPSGAAALYLLADLSSDAGNDDAAIGVYRELYTRYPASSRADDARFRAAILDLAHGRSRSAAVAFDSIVAGPAGSSERTAARYWSGRAWSAVGDQKRARASWSAITADEPTSYYAVASARRLSQPSWSPAIEAETFVAVPAVDSAFARIALLDRLGMDTEARFELDAVEGRAAGSTDMALAIANAFRARGETPRAIRLANKLIERGERSARVYRLAFPVVDRAELERQSKAQGLDPALVAGLIKQESSFEPRAVSAANARGLMQVLPSVGEQIARSLRYPVWSPSLLFDADVNLQIGASHLAAATKQYGDPTRVLAAYNAGASRVDRWSKKTGAADPELFAEQIPFVETRDYVRIVQRNREMYRTLYGLGESR